MAKLKTRTFYFPVKTGGEFKFTSEVSVTADGVFHLTIPEELASTANALADREKDIDVIPSRANWTVVGKNLEACESFIKHVGDDYVACEISEEPVILYGADTRCAYFKGTDGLIYPNGAKGGNWCGNIHATSRAPFYSVGFAAFCLIKVTYTRGSGTKVEYKYEREAFGPYWKLLNSFCGLEIHHRSLKEMPYTEEAAKFFYDTMLGLCHLADRINTFFGSKEALTAAIAAQAPLLIAAPRQEN